MDENIYQPPKAEVSTDNVGDTSSAEFYIVSRKKFLILYIMTLGLYSLYWFYKNWARYRDRHGVSIWPVPRAIFSIFFTHSLFRNVQSTLDEKGSTYRWAHSAMATLYVVTAILSHILDRMAMREIGSPITDFLSLGMLFLTTYALYQGQLAINVACEDPDGDSNSVITGANIAWIIFGALLWALVLVGIAVMLFDL